MAEKSTENRNRVTSMTTPHGRLCYLDRRPGEGVLCKLAEDLAKTGRPEGYAFATDCRQNKKEGGLYLLPGDALSFSILLRPPMHVTRSGVISMIAAVAACRVLERNSALQTGIAWISDVMAEDRKVAAFRMTGNAREDGFWHYLILNAAISIRPGDYNERLSDVVGRVFSNRNSDIGDRLADDFLAEFFAMYESFSTDDAFAEEYNRRILYRGRRFRTQVGNRSVTGRAEGMSASGQLILRQKGEQRLNVCDFGNTKELFL